MRTLNKLAAKERFFEKDFFVFDVETRGLRAKPDAFIFGVIYGYQFTKVIYTVEEFKKEFEDKRYLKKKVFAHNAEYDLSTIYDNIYNIDNSAIFNNRFIAATNGCCIFADSFNIFSTSVATVGKMIGLPKLDLDSGFINGTKKEVTEKDIEYCTRDCEIIFRSLLQIFELIGNVKITLAGCSLDYFRRKYLKFHIDYNEELSNYFFNSYYGGRCEAFKIGKIDNAVVYDINSSYPYAMFNSKFPNPKYLKKAENVSINIFIKKYLERYEGCAFLTIKHNNNYFGSLPLKKGGKLLFPVGTFTGWWNFNELRFSLENKLIEIIEIKEIIYSTPMESPFKEFISDNFAKRFESGQEFPSYLYKILMNSLYGKFAQRILTEFIYIKSMSKDYQLINDYRKSGQLLKLSIFNPERDDCFLEVTKNNAKFLYHSIPLFSSYITSYSRIYLLEYLLKYKEFNPVYCDTDSIFFEKDPLIDYSKKLGGWKKEEKIIIEINGLKNY
jgi:hypothetical protein